MYITRRVYSSVSKRTTVPSDYATDRRRTWNKCRLNHRLECLSLLNTHLSHSRSWLNIQLTHKVTVYGRGGAGFFFLSLKPPLVCGCPRRRSCQCHCGSQVRERILLSTPLVAAAVSPTGNLCTAQHASQSVSQS